MKKICITLLFAFSILFATINVSAASIKIAPTSVNMLKGETKKLSIKGTKKKAKWSSKNKKVATVSAKGVVTAKRKGTTTIYAKIGNKKYSRKVHVYNVGDYLFKSYKAVGDDKVYINSADGTSEFGMKVVPYKLAFPPKGYENWFIPAQVGLHILNRDDEKGLEPYSNPIYWIYVDKKLVQKESVPYRSDGTLKGSKETSTKGIHTVEIIRYEKGNPRKEPVFYKKLKYKIIPR